MKGLPSRLLAPVVWVVALGAACPAAAGEAAPEPAKAAVAESARAEGATAPYAAVRSLQALQDQVARGSAAAQGALPRMLLRVAEAFAAAEPAAWTEPRNADAAALYLFSAGRPSALRGVLERGVTFAPSRDRLVKGALAYAEGQDDVARALLKDVDPKALPAGVGGHLALVVATLFADKEPARADAMLDVARLLVPGTLVEEAALRRQIFLLADPASLDKFAALSRQYMRRYRDSAFAANFKGRFLSFAVRLAEAGDAARLGRLDPALAELPAAERRGLYLTLARDALVAGKPEAARYAAARAAALGPDPAEAERGKLYAAAAAAASDSAPAARVALGAIDPSRLPARDAELRDAAVAVAGEVDAGLGDRGQDLADTPAPAGAPAMALVARARRALAEGDRLAAVEVGPKVPAPAPLFPPVAP